MSEANLSPNLEAAPPWRFVRLDQYRRPAPPTRETVRKGLFGIWDRLRRTPAADESPALEIDLEIMPGTVLAEAAPDPDWGDAVPVLHEALRDWEAGGNAARVQVLMGAPYSGTAEIVAHWAARHECPVLPDPPVEQIFDGGNQYLEQLDQAPERGWVIPRLERWYLRHSQGLTLLRRLLDHISSRPGRFLLGCDSWAWAYLSKALQIEALLPSPLVLEAFDQEKLARWLRGLAVKTPQRDFVFRQADNGRLVLPPPEGEAPAGGGENGGSDPGGRGGNDKVTDFLARLAAHSRGIPGVAWATWRYSLRLAHEEEVQAKAREVAPDHEMHRTIWVTPWPQLNLPTLSGLERRGQDLFVLHALLLHDGLPGQLLAHLLPVPESQTRHSLLKLRAAGVVTSEAERWRVAALAYPAVRDFLQSEGYLVDAL